MHFGAILSAFVAARPHRAHRKPRQVEVDMSMETSATAASDFDF